MAKRNDVKIVLTTSFVVPAPTDDELIELATEAGIAGEEPTEEELDSAYESWKDTVAEEFEDGTREVPAIADHDLDMEEVYK